MLAKCEKNWEKEEIDELKRSNEKEKRLTVWITLEIPAMLKDLKESIFRDHFFSCMSINIRLNSSFFLNQNFSQKFTSE